VSKADDPPEGYDGFCGIEVNGKVCGRPGHLQGGPGPYSSIYCEEHQDVRPLDLSYLLWIPILLLLLVLLWWLFS